MRPALLIIDMLNDFVKGSLKIPGAEEIVDNIRKLAEEFRRLNLPVIYVCDSHVKGVDLELKVWGDHAIRGTWGAQVIDELKPTERDFIVLKRRYSGFFQTDLELLLKELGVDTVVLTGVSTDVCVQHTAADAFFRGYRIVVVEDATAAFTEEGHRNALEYMKRVYKAQVTSTKQLIDALHKQHL